MALKLKDSTITEDEGGEGEGVQINNTTPEQDEIDPDFHHICAQLNEFVVGFPAEYKRFLVTNVNRVKRAITEELQSVESISNSDKAGNMSEILSVSFQSLSLVLDESFNYSVQLSPSDKSHLLELFEDYLNTIYYKFFFLLILPTEDTNEAFSPQPIIEKYSTMIVPEDLKLRLDMDNVDVRSCIYTAVRNLVLLESQRSPQKKLNSIQTCCKLVLTALVKSSNGKPVSADEILPALIYIIIKSKVADIHHQLVYISTFIGFRQNLDMGEAAYFFTNMLAALEAIKTGLGLPGSNGSTVTESEPNPSTADESKRFLETSVTVIHNEVQGMLKKQRLDITEHLRQFAIENNKLISREESQKIEKKYWNVIKWIPGLNVGYGTIRSIVYGCRNNRKEALGSVVGAVGGALGVGVAIAGGLVGGPIIVPILVSMVSGTAANQLVTGGGELLIDAIEEPDSFMLLSPDGREKEFYEKILRDIAVIGGIYSVIRSAVYLGKNSKKEAMASGISAGVNVFSTLVGVGVGVGMSRLATSLATKVPPGAIVASVAEGADDVVKPIATEVIDVITEFGIKVVTNPNVNAAARTGATALTKAALEKAQSYYFPNDDPDMTTF